MLHPLQLARRALAALQLWASPRLSELSQVAAMAAVMPAAQFSGPERDPLRLVCVLVFVVYAFALHELAHAWVAWKLGDPTAKDLGRVTFNPIPSIDPVFTVLMPAAALFLGWPFLAGAKPVPVMYHKLRNPARDMMLVALAGPATNFLLAVLLLAAYKLAVYQFDFSQGSMLASVLWTAMVWNISLTAFNLLPIPPLDGSRVLAWLLPAEVREYFHMLERFGLVVVLLVMQLPFVRGFYSDTVRELFAAVKFLAGGEW